MGVRLSEDQIRCFETYLSHLLFWNPRTGLISSRDEHRVPGKHFLDSLCLLSVIDLLAGARVLDVGSGGGFPGLPLKILRPEMCLTLLEPKERRYFFLKDLVRTLGLQNVSVRCQRAEEAAGDSRLRKSFDLVLSRAVARLDRLIGICGGFLREGGVFFAYKGSRVDEELALASDEIVRAGAELQGVVPVKVPGISAQRCLVMISVPLKGKESR